MSNSYWLSCAILRPGIVFKPFDVYLILNCYGIRNEFVKRFEFIRISIVYLRIVVSVAEFLQ